MNMLSEIYSTENVYMHVQTNACRRTSWYVIIWLYIYISILSVVPDEDYSKKLVMRTTFRFLLHKSLPSKTHVLHVYEIGLINTLYILVSIKFVQLDVSVYTGQPAVSSILPVFFF